MNEPTTQPEWSATSYASNVDHHRRHDGEFIDDLHPASDARILDIGCGVGDFTESLAELVPEGRVVGIDSSASMLAEASQRRRPNLEFGQCDAQHLAGADLGGPFDLIVSRACLHWVPGEDHRAVLAGAASQLRSGGRLRAEFGGAGNIPRTLPHMLAVAAQPPFAAELPSPLAPWYFATPGEYLDLLLASPFDDAQTRVWSAAQLRVMGEDDEGLKSWFRSQVGISVTHLLPERLAGRYEAEVLDRIVAPCRRPDGSTAEIYVRLNVDARMP